jgi:tricarballylate dehydrogenase
VEQTTESADVIVVGAGNAAISAALSAREAGASVIVLESSSQEERGGNSTYTGGFFRFPYEGLADIEPMLNDASRKWIDRVEVEPYPQERMLADLRTQSRNRCDPELTDVYVSNAADAVRWLHAKGVTWQFPVGKVHDMEKLPAGVKYTLAGGAALVTEEEGVGLVENLFKAVERAGIGVYYDSPVDGLLRNGSRVTGVRVRTADGWKEFHGTVVLGAGGFGANPEMRLRYLGPGWDLVKVRGSRFSSGAVLNLALEAGAAAAGHWGGCHASALASNAPEVGRVELTDKMSRYSYPYCIMVNINGERFTDEGANHLWLTYASTGAAIQRQPDATAWQIFDQKTAHLLEPRYELSEPVVADTIEELAGKLGIDPGKLADTVAGFNAATRPGTFDPFKKDGLATVGLDIKKSNWAQPISQGPFIAYGVTCGLTFTYGGVKIDTSARVIDTEGQPLPGLYATGEITGGVFYHHYAAGSGLTFGTVFGRIAGQQAAAAARAL